MTTTQQEFIERLNEIQNNSSVNHVMLPSDEPRFIINMNTRAIIVPDEFQFLAVKSDTNAETFYFEVDRYFDDVDLSSKTCIVQYAYSKNDGIVEGIFPVVEIDVKTVPGKIIFGWTIQSEVTQAAALISFSVRFYSVTNESAPDGTVATLNYSLNTLPARLYVLDTLDVTPGYFDKYPALFEEWNRRMMDMYSGVSGMTDNVHSLQKQAGRTEKSLKWLWEMNRNQTYVVNTVEHEGMSETSAFNGYCNVDCIFGKTAESKSVDQIHIKIASRNLFDKDNVNVINNAIIVAPDAKIVSALYETLCVWMPCEPNKTYTISRTHGPTLVVGDTATIPTESPFLIHTNGGAGTLDSLTFYTSSNARYLVIYAWKASETLTRQEILDSLQVEYGFKTDYVPYWENTFTITPPRPLSTAGDSRDKCDIVNGVWSYSTGDAQTVPIDTADLDLLRDLTYLDGENIFITDNWSRDLSYLLSEYIKNDLSNAAKDYVDGEISRVNEHLLSGDYRISNLEAAARGQLYNGYTDTSAAYQKAAPANALPIAEILSMGGAVSRVRITGKNIFDKSSGNQSSVLAISSEANVAQQSSTTTTLYVWLPCDPSTTYTISKIAGERFSVGDCSEEPTKGKHLNSVTTDRTASSIQHTTSSDAKYLAIYAWNSTYDAVISREDALNSLQVEIGSVATAYEPYRETVYPIPAAIQALPGYGWIAGSLHNEVDYHNRKYIRRVGAVDISTLNLVYSAAYPRFSAPISDMVHRTGRSTLVSCEEYNTATDGSDRSVFTAYQEVYIYDSRYTRASLLKDAMRGVMLYYELADPTVTDLSDILTTPIYIRTGDGSVIIFEQSGDAKKTVPSTIEYAVKLGV